MLRRSLPLRRGSDRRNTAGHFKYAVSPKINSHQTLKSEFQGRWPIVHLRGRHHDMDDMLNRGVGAGGHLAAGPGVPVLTGYDTRQMVSKAIVLPFSTPRRLCGKFAVSLF